MNAILRFSALGDIAALLPVLRAFASKPTIITSPLGKELLKDEFSDFIILESKSFIDILKTVYMIRKRKFNSIIDFQLNDRSAMIIFLSFLNVNAINEKHKNKDKNATVHFYNIANKYISLKELDTQFIKQKSDYIVINAGSSPAWVSKRLPNNKWKEIITTLYTKYNLKVILTGDKSEKIYLDTIINDNPDIPIENFAGKTTIQELKEVLKNAFLTVSTDSAAMHISAAMKTPTIGLFGPTNWSVSAPFGPWSTVVYDKIYFKDGRPLEKNSKEISNYFDHISIDEALCQLSDYLKV